MIQTTLLLFFFTPPFKPPSPKIPKIRLSQPDASDFHQSVYISGFHQNHVHDAYIIYSLKSQLSKCMVLGTEAKWGLNDVLIHCSLLTVNFETPESIALTNHSLAGVFSVSSL